LYEGLFEEKTRRVVVEKRKDVVLWISVLKDQHQGTSLSLNRHHNRYGYQNIKGSLHGFCVMAGLTNKGCTLIFNLAFGYRLGWCSLGPTNTQSPKSLAETVTIITINTKY
jgi:hypothetical protein